MQKSGPDSNFPRHLLQKPFFISNSGDHSMDKYLKKYLYIKVHPLIDNSSAKEIIVVGQFDRDEGISTKEKTGKIHNWQRPTAAIADNKLIIKCFPGSDYVRHNASVIASYLAITGKDPDTVSYILPSEEQCWEPILKSEYEKLPRNKGIIFGYGLAKIFPEAVWTEMPNYYYSTAKFSNKTMTLLMVKHSFWGDIGARLTARLIDLGFSQIIFIGKLGTFDENCPPNRFIATGTSSYVEGEIINWKNIFKNLEFDNVVEGAHITIPSVLFETKLWVSEVAAKYRFVDPEIGQMARACVRKKADFSFLHIISDNVSRPFRENLSNERENAILNKRQNILLNMRNILTANL